MIHLLTDILGPRRGDHEIVINTIYLVFKYHLIPHLVRHIETFVRYKQIQNDWYGTWPSLQLLYYHFFGY